MKTNKTILLKRMFSVILIIMFLFTCSTNIITASSNECSVGLNEELSDYGELENFCDNFFSEYMKAEKVPSAVVSIVKNGETLLKKGYGYADIENNVLADPNKTAYNICSIGKLLLRACL